MKPNDPRPPREDRQPRQPDPGSRNQAGPIFDQTGHTVGQAFNTAGNATIVLNPAPPPATQPAAPPPRKRAEALPAIEREFACNLRDLDRLYIIPDLQDFNPPDEANSPGLIASRQPAFGVVDDFLARPGLETVGHRCLFILGDAGMGKTSLLLMLANRHFQAPPAGRQCVLMKLGPDTLDRLAAVPEPGSTVLLLDSLDEDPVAHDHAQGAEGRLLDLLPRLAPFFRVVLTCRSQFFPENSPRLTTLAGHFVVGPHECPLKYLSLFNDAQVEDYLRKRYEPGLLEQVVRAFTGTEGTRLPKAREAARSMESLRLRPLLLSRIDDFVNDDDRRCVDFRNTYAVYHRLVDQWLMRDAQKHLGLSADESWRVAVLLSLHLARQGTRMIHRQALAVVPGLERVPQFKIEARSLLNRNKDHQYQFAHATIQEFLIAHAILDPSAAFDVASLQLSREAYRFLIHGKAFLELETVDLRGARAGFPEAAIEWIRQACGLDMVAISPGEFLMGSPPDETGRYANETQHRVRLTRLFWIGRYPVTQAEWAAVMGDNPSHFKGPQRPVESVDREQAMAFCATVTERARAAGCLPEDFEFRLPTEAEWEYACRAGTTSAYNDGSDCTQPYGKDPKLEPLGWHGEGAEGQTHPVGAKRPNAWGLHDMHGNVWEWCLDCAEWKDAVVTDTYLDGVEDPLCQQGARRVVRGGSCWNGAGYCRSAYRYAYEPGRRDWDLGFRLAAGQPPAQPAAGRGAPGQAAGGAAAPVPEAPAARPASGESRRKSKTEVGP